jgi:anti-anti-sigma regulatory factor
LKKQENTDEAKSVISCIVIDFSSVNYIDEAAVESLINVNI